MQILKTCTAAAIAATVAVTFSTAAQADWRGNHWNGGGYSHYHGRYYGHYHGDGFAAAVILGALIGMAVDNQASRAAYYYPAPPPVVYQAPPPRVVYQAPPQGVYAVPPPAAEYATPTVASAAPSTCVMTREYQTTITIGGKPHEAYGTACLRPDGSWLQGPAKLVPNF